METEVGISTLAIRVKELRSLLGKSAETFADETGIGLGALRYIEQGRTLNPGINIIEQICTRYGVSEKWLIRNVGPVFDTPEKLEVERNDLKAELDQAYEQVEQWKTEAINHERVWKALLSEEKARTAIKKERLGKVERVSTGSVRQVRKPMIYQLLPTLQATRLVMS